MPETLKEKVNKIDFSINTAFNDYLQNIDLSIMKVADGVKVSRGHLYQCLNCQRQIYPPLRARLNTYLGTNF